MDLPAPASVASRSTLSEQIRSGFRRHFSNYQMEHSRNLIFMVGGRMDQVFQALIDPQSRAPLDLKSVETDPLGKTRAGPEVIARETCGRGRMGSRGQRDLRMI